MNKENDVYFRILTSRPVVTDNSSQDNEINTAMLNHVIFQQVTITLTKSNDSLP